MSRAPEFEAWINKAREADILEEALARGAILRRTGGEHVGPCPLCGGTDRFSINPVKQIFNCRGAVGGDVIRMVEHIESVSFLSAVESINHEPPPGRDRHVATEEEKKRNQEQRQRAQKLRDQRSNEAQGERARQKKRAGQIWRSSVVLDGTLAESYLRSRGIPRPDEGWPLQFRFAASISYPDQEHMPALVCRVDGQDGIPRAIWRIYLARDGLAKAPVPKSKLGLGPASGGAVRIGGVADHIGVAEGVESALGAWMLTGLKFPVWAALSTSGMVGIELPDRVKRVTIFPDGDKPTRRKGHDHIPSEPAGRKAAMSLRVKLQEQGIACDIAAEPPAGKDYLDLWVATQRNAA